jgi:hypothetical protein
MQEDSMETPAEENDRLKAELADAKKALTAAKQAKALQEENERLSVELAAIRAEAARLAPPAAAVAAVAAPDRRIDILCSKGFSLVEATGLIPLLDAPATTALALDALGRIAFYTRIESLSGNLLYLQATIRK